jgi:D-amino-acid dehydrogenase
VLGESLRSLGAPDSALYFAPAYVPRMIPWLLRFAWRCNRRHYRRGAEALAGLGRRSFELLDGLAAEGVEFQLQRGGVLAVAERGSAITTLLEALALLRSLGHGVPERALDGAAARQLEPAISERVTAGAMIEEHWHVEPTSLTKGLTARLRAMDVRVEEGAEVVDLVGRDGQVRLVRTAAGDVEPDAVVLAAGSWTPRLARMLGMRLPLQPGKGYSFEVRPTVMPRRALMLIEPHVACSPFGDRLRVAGTMEFSGINARLDDRRIESIERGAGRLVNGWGPSDVRARWAGLRPIAPDGLPIVGRPRGYRNVYLATGYSMLGMTVAAPAGESLAAMILSDGTAADLAPFAPGRFAVGKGWWR